MRDATKPWATTAGTADESGRDQGDSPRRGGTVMSPAKQLSPHVRDCVRRQEGKPDAVEIPWREGARRELEGAACIAIPAERNAPLTSHISHPQMSNHSDAALTGALPITTSATNTTSGEGAARGG